MANLKAFIKPPMVSPFPDMLHLGISRYATSHLFSLGNRLIQAAKVSNGQAVRTDDFSYDDSGSISQNHYAEVSDSATVMLANNDDNRLASGSIYRGALLEGEEQYIYDHLGQRTIKIGEVPTFYAYDIFGNFFAEFDVDHDPIATYIYLGNHRLAMLGGTLTGSLGCSMGKSLVQGAKSNWAIIIILPVIFILALKYRKNKLVVGVLVVIGGSAIILIAMNEAGSTLTYNEAIYYYHNDHLGTPQVMTNSSGTVVWDASYQPFGKINSLPTATITNRFRFPGQYQDDMTGMYYNHHRYYMPEVGRYNRFDPYFKIDNTFYHPFIYALHNPLKYFDIMGLDIQCDCGTFGASGETIGFRFFACNCETSCCNGRIQSGRYTAFFISWLSFGLPFEIEGLSFNIPGYCDLDVMEGIVTYDSIGFLLGGDGYSRNRWRFGGISVTNQDIFNPRGYSLGVDIAATGLGSFDVIYNRCCSSTPTLIARRN